MATIPCGQKIGTAEGSVVGTTSVNLTAETTPRAGRTFQVLDSGYPHLSVWLRFHTLFSATR